MQGRRGFFLVLGALAAAPAVAFGQATQGAGASPAPSGRVQLFNIPAQQLRSALEAYSIVTRSQLIYDSRLVATRRSSAVVGLFTRETALRMLLDGSDLAIRYNGPQEIALVAATAPRSDPDGPEAVGEAEGGLFVLDTLHVDVAPGADRPDYAEYGRDVRSQIKRALAQSADTANRVYQIQFDVFVAPDGQLWHSRLLRSSGKASLDGAVRHVIEATKLKSPPPEGMPQPVRVTIISI